MTDRVRAITVVPICSNWLRNDDKNLVPGPPLWEANCAILPLNVYRQFLEDTDSQAMALDKIGGTPPLYSGAQNNKPSEFKNTFSTDSIREPSTKIPG